MSYELQYSTIRYPVSQSQLEVYSPAASSSSSAAAAAANPKRTFELRDTQGRVLHSTISTIREIGLCYQVWSRQEGSFHKEVRLFVTKGRLDAYMIAVDVLHTEIAFYRVDTGAIDKWHFNRHPDVDHSNWFVSMFRKYYLAPNLSWDDHSKRPDLWVRKNDQSEVDITREGKILDAQITERVIAQIPVTYLSNRGDQFNQWSLLRAIERVNTIGQSTSLVMDIINFNQAEVKPIDYDNKMITYAQGAIRLNGNPLSERHALAYGLGPDLKPLKATHLDLANSYPDFMPRGDLRNTPCKQIANYVAKIITTPQGGAVSQYDLNDIIVTKELHIFPTNMMSGGVHICIKSGMFQKLWKAIRNKFPGGADTGMLNMTLIQGFILQTLMNNVPAQQQALVELKRSEDKAASMHIYISFNRTEARSLVEDPTR